MRSSVGISGSDERSSKYWRASRAPFSSRAVNVRTAASLRSPAGNSSVTRRALPSRLPLPHPLSSYEEAPAEDTSYLTVELVPFGARRGSAGCLRLDDHQPF